MQRYALVTGASCGIGLALAEALARRGQPLILLARRKDKLESIAAELAQRFDVEVLYRVCDLETDPKLYMLRGDVKDHFRLQPAQYMAYR